MDGSRNDVGGPLWYSGDSDDASSRAQRGDITYPICPNSFHVGQEEPSGPTRLLGHVKRYSGHHSTTSPGSNLITP